MNLIWVIPTKESKMQKNNTDSYGAVPRNLSPNVTTPRFKTLKDLLAPFSLIVVLLLLWQVICIMRLVPRFMLPSPLDILRALISDRPLIFYHTAITLYEAFFGVTLSVIIAFIVAAAMDGSTLFKKAAYPVLVSTQTVPTIAIAPIFVLWFGYGATSRVILIILTCFFPIAVNLAQGFCAVDNDEITLLKSFGATKFQIFFLLKVPSSVPYFLSALKIALSYSIITAVVAEWLGGNEGLGVYMIRVKKSYSFDKMFAAIIVVSVLSLILMKIIALIERRVEV